VAQICAAIELLTAELLPIRVRLVPLPIPALSCHQNSTGVSTFEHERDVVELELAAEQHREKTFRFANVYTKRPENRFQNIHSRSISRSDRRLSLRDSRVAAKGQHTALARIIEQEILGFSAVPTSYEDAVKSSVIIPSSLDVLERSPDKYNLNNNNSSSSNANHIGLTSPSSTAVALKIEEVSNETSNLMLEDRQNTATRCAPRPAVSPERDSNFFSSRPAAHRTPLRRPTRSAAPTASRPTATWPS
jgi:hypothetical protein